MSSSAASSAQGEMDAWNRQPLKSWEWNELRARLRTKAYDNGLLEDSFKTSVLAHIKKNQFDGVDLCQFYTIAHGLRRKEQRAAMVALTWLPEGSHHKSQIMALKNALFNIVESNMCFSLGDGSIASTSSGTSSRDSNREFSELERLPTRSNESLVIHAIAKQLNVITSRQEKIDSSLMVMRADVARVKFSVDDNVRLARLANATNSGRQSTEAWFKTLREAAVDTDRINSMCSKVRDPRLYEVLWASFWQYLDSLALSDTVFCQDYDQLRKSHIFADEKQTQAFFNRAITWLIARLIARLSAIGCELVFRDTSSSRAPVHPHHKFDMSFVSTNTISARDNVSVLWNEVVMIAELKQDLDNAMLRKEVLIQAANGLVELRAQQINREREFAFISDARGFQLFVRTDDRGSDEIITSGLLPLFTPSHSGPTSGFVVLVNLLVTTAAQLGLPPRADSSFKFPKIPEGFVDKKAKIFPHRTGSESKPDIYFVGQEYVLKHFAMHQGFEIEQRMFELIGRVAPKCEHLPHMVKVHVATRSMLILPLASRSWADAELSTALTWEVLQAACVVLPLIHSHGFVHGDISPYNILVGNANGKVFINDFSCSLPIGTVLRVFCGTLDFASDALGVLLLGDSSRPYTYLPLDDHKSLFFSVLSRYWPSSSPASSCKPHLPWSNEPIKANLLQVKALCVLNHHHMLFTDELRTHVGDIMFAFLQRWFELLFRSDGAFSSCSLIVDHLKSFVQVVGSVVASDKPSQAACNSTGSVGHVFPPPIRTKSAALHSSAVTMFLLYESASGFALFERVESEQIGAQTLEVIATQTDLDLARFSKLVRMKAFQPFVSAEQALENQNDISEGIFNDTLRGFLEQNLDKPKPGKLTKFQLGVTDVKIGQAVQDEMSIKCVSDELVLELMRGIRFHLPHFIGGLKAGDMEKAQLGLAHSYLLTGEKRQKKQKRKPVIIEVAEVAAADVEDDQAERMRKKTEKREKEAAAATAAAEEALEQRLVFYETGAAPRKNIDVMRLAVAENLAVDGAAAPAAGEKKKKRKSDIMEVAEVATTDVEDDEAERKRKKKEKKAKEAEAAVEEESAAEKSAKKKKKSEKA